MKVLLLLLRDVDLECTARWNPSDGIDFEVELVFRDGRVLDESNALDLFGLEFGERAELFEFDGVEVDEVLGVEFDVFVGVLFGGLGFLVCGLGALFAEGLLGFHVPLDFHNHSLDSC